MNRWKPLSQRWRELGITLKFAFAFGLLLGLITLVSLTSYLALTAVRRQTEAAIVTSMEIQRLVLEMDAGLQHARRLEKDFFLRWPAVGFSQALETYSRNHDEEIAQVMAHSAKLQGLIAESDVSDALRESEVSLSFYLSAADRYAATFDEAIQLVTRLATDETGAQARLADSSELLHDALQGADDPALIVLYREMQSFEKDYLVTRQRPYMQSAFNVADLLREAIRNSSGLDGDQSAQALVYLDDYLSVADEVLLLDVEIGHKLNEFDLQAEAIDPISEELTALANAETQRARQGIARTSRLATTLLIVAVLAAVALAGVIGLALNNSITRNVVNLTRTAGELRGGNLEIRARIDSADELGQLADSFNAMATRIKTLVDTLEQKVEERTADLTTTNLQLQQEISERMRAEAERERLLAAERRRADELDALRTTMADVTAELELPTLLQAIVERAAGLLNATGGELGLYDESSQEIRVVVSHNMGKAYVGTLHRLGEGAMGHMAETGEPLIIEDYQTWEGRAPQYADAHIHAGLGAPLEAGGRLVGAITIMDSDPDRQFTPADLHLLTLFAQQAAIAIENARLYEDSRASQEYARNIIDSSLDPIIAVDRERRVVEFNRAAQDTFGYRPEEILGRDADVLYVDREEGFDIHRTTLEQGHCIREVRNRRKNGEVFPAFLSSSLLRDAQGELVGIMGVSRDITERVQAEAELRKYQEHLEELVEERTAELQASEERYRTLFDGVPVGLYRTTPAGQIVDANLALVHMLGYSSRKDLLAINSASLYVEPEGRGRWQALMERKGVVREFETQMYKNDGTVIWVNNSARAVRDEGGRVLHYEGSLEDITERVQAEAELRKYQEHLEELVEERTAELQASEERYRTLFDGVPIGLFRATQAGQVLDANLAMVHMLGYPSREDLLRTDPGSLYVDLEKRVLGKALIEQEGVVRDFETQVYKHDGTVIWVSYTGRVVIDEEGQVLYYEGSLEDITQRKEFEEEIRRQKEYYEALFVNNPAAVVSVDTDAKVVAWNPRAEELFGYTQAEAIGKSLDDLIADDPKVRAEALHYTDQVFTMGRVQATTKRTRKDGALVDVEVLALPIIVARQTIGYIAIYHDIGELQQARREAEAANQAKSAFLANMSHELRTPLNAILGFTQLMDRDPSLSPQQQENLGIINRSGEHLLALINDVLEMSKIEAGRVTLEEKSFDLYHLLDGLEEMFRLRAEDEGLVLTFERAKNVPRHVRTDEGKLRQVLSNLLGNAVKFTRHGGVALRVGTRDQVRKTKELPSQATLVFEVEDTGPGIAPEELATVFDPFVQAISEQRPQEGTGLGLSISRQFVRLMGGDLSVSSELGRGTLFSFDVRVELVSAVEVQAARPTRRVLALASDQPIYRLLVAEDRDTNRRLLVKLLESLRPSPLRQAQDGAGSGQGFEVREAINGREAIEIWERWEPHLIWMDMRMPLVDGYQATRHIKSEIRNRKSEIQTVIIALTASAFEEDREKVLSHGCDDFVRKPFREDEIYDMLAKHLGVRFVYEEDAVRTEDVSIEADTPLQDALTPAAVAALPATWAADLRKATIKADLNQILALVDQVYEENPALAEALADLAHKFEYKKILALIE